MPPRSLIWDLKMESERNAASPAAKRKRLDQDQPTLPEHIQQFTKYGVNSKQQQEANERLVDTLCTGGVPFNLVENVEFKYWQDLVAPKYHIHHRTTYSRQVNIIYHLFYITAPNLGAVQKLCHAVGGGEGGQGPPYLA